MRVETALRRNKGPLLYDEAWKIACRFHNKDLSHRSKSDRSVKLLRDEFMLTVNAQQTETPSRDMRISDFWEQRYLPVPIRNRSTICSKYVQ